MGLRTVSWLCGINAKLHSTDLCICFSSVLPSVQEGATVKPCYTSECSLWITGLVTTAGSSNNSGEKEKMEEDRRQGRSREQSCRGEDKGRIAQEQKESDEIGH